jgi:phage terminase small subunit
MPRNKSPKKAAKRRPPKGPGRSALILTAKEELFCHEFLIDLNATQAAKRAKYSNKTAGAIGHELLKKPKIAAEIDRLRHKALMRADLTLDDLVKELKHLSLWTIRDFVETGNTIVDISTLDRETLKPVVGIKTTLRYDPDGKPVKTVELKMVDKRAGVIDLIRHKGGFEKDNLQKAMKIKVTRK